VTFVKSFVERQGKNDGDEDEDLSNDEDIYCLVVFGIMFLRWVREAPLWRMGERDAISLVGY
jgi:hypothetical protein